MVPYLPTYLPTYVVKERKFCKKSNFGGDTTFQNLKICAKIAFGISEASDRSEVVNIQNRKTILGQNCYHKLAARDHTEAFCERAIDDNVEVKAI